MTKKEMKDFKLELLKMKRELSEELLEQAAHLTETKDFELFDKEKQMVQREIRRIEIIVELINEKYLCSKEGLHVKR